MIFPVISCLPIKITEDPYDSLRIRVVVLKNLRNPALTPLFKTVTSIMS